VESELLVRFLSCQFLPIPQSSVGFSVKVPKPQKPASDRSIRRADLQHARTIVFFVGWKLEVRAPCPMSAQRNPEQSNNRKLNLNSKESNQSITKINKKMPVSFEETKDEPNVNEDANDKADGLNDFENGIIQEEYKIWKKNSPFLYDFVMTYSLDWPSLTVQWLPDKSVTSSTTSHKLILGTQSDGTDQNYLMIADVRASI
jgi:hypothetical protein